MSQHIAVIGGDGIGPEVIAEALRVLAYFNERDGLGITLEHFDYGADRYLADGTTFPPEMYDHFGEHFDAILLGALGDSRVPSNIHAKEILLGLRFNLDLYINFRPVTLLDARYCPLKDKTEADIDFVVFRENTEGLYTGLGGQFKRTTSDEVAIEVEVNTRKGVERIIRAAFEYAQAHDLKSVCMSDKANAMRHGHELWQRVFSEVSKEFPAVQASHLYVDVLAMELVRAPEQFDVIVTNNLFGDIITDLGAQIQGGIGLAASGNIHPNRTSLFEPVHGSAPDIAGTNQANPLAAILSVGLLLEHLGHTHTQTQIIQAVRSCLNSGQVTKELGGNLSTQGVTDAILAALN